MAKVTFRIVKSADQNYYWTAFLPTQIKKFKTFKEAEKNMALVVDRIQRGKIELEVHDVTAAKGPTNYVGGLRQLMSKIGTTPKKGG